MDGEQPFQNDLAQSFLTRLASRTVLRRPMHFEITRGQRRKPTARFDRMAAE